MAEYPMTCVAPTVSAVLHLPVPAGARGTAVPQVVADLEGVRKVALLVLDALGKFAWDLWNEEMPYLRSLHARRSLLLRAVMPSITPVNFAAMVTGTDQAGHGIRTFRDTFACETLFDVVRRSGGKSAGVGLSGYTGNELLARHADIAGNAGKGTDDAVAEKIRECVEPGPTFLIAQFGRVDDVFHKYGPSSPAVVPMLRETDARMKDIVAHLGSRGYGLMILADHGQHDMSETNGKCGTHGTDSDQDCLVPCTWVAPGEGSKAD